ncbi:uncharacterized protein [Miscanthus floridulus]|uniref:uncharacterized protein n=1 Tax=Miscanthus floridulus TaxID=154761 RepID=UPI0034575D96
MAETDAEREAEDARRRQAEAARTAALDAYEAKHADVHAAAIAVLNIKVLVPVVLDRTANNYNRWCALFLVVLGKYALTDHVLTDVVNADRPAWVQMDCTVLTWIYDTINADLQQSTMLKNPNAHVARLHLEDEFLGQRESRALLLSAEFRTAKQGSSSITDFCRRLKTMAATLRDFGDPVGDRTLILTLLRGLSGKFRPMVTNIKLRQPFPTFVEARTLLLLEEIDLDDIAAGEAADEAAEASDPPASSTSTTLVAAPRSSNGRGGHGHGSQGGYGGQHSHDGQPSNGQGGYGGQTGHQRSGRRCGGRGRNQQQQAASTTSGGPRPPAPFYNPWAGHVQFWPCPPNGSGMPYRPPLAAFTAQQQHVQQPYTFGPPPGFGYGAPPPPQQQQQPWTPMQGTSWDPSALIHNFNTMTLTPPPPADWYADSGAGAHMDLQTRSVIARCNSTGDLYPFFPALPAPLLSSLPPHHPPPSGIVASVILDMRLYPSSLAPMQFHFDSSIKAVQCDNGREFDHSSARMFFLTHGVVLRMSCPYTSQ